MNNAIQPYDQDQRGLIRQTFAPKATEQEFQLFIALCERTGLDPFKRHIYLVSRWSKEDNRYVHAVQTSIDGFRAKADQHGKYAGQIGPFWCGADGQWRDVWTANEPPAAAKVGALRSDFQEPCWGVARFDAYAQRKKDGGLTSMWEKMPDVMLAKCAEALALRKAFPDDLGGLYTGDEMAQAAEVVDVENDAPTDAPAALPAKSEPDKPITKAQYQDLVERFRDNGWKNSTVKAYLASKGYERGTDIRRRDYMAITLDADDVGVRLQYEGNEEVAA